MKLIFWTFIAANLLILSACAQHLYESRPVGEASSDPDEGMKLLRYNLIEPMVFIKLEPDDKNKDALKYKVTLEPKNKKIVAYDLFYKKNWWYKDDIEANVDKSLVLSSSDTTSTPQFKEVIETVGELVGKAIEAGKMVILVKKKPTPVPFEYTLSPCRAGSGSHSLKEAQDKLSKWKTDANFPEEITLNVSNQEECQKNLFIVKEKKDTKANEDKVCFIFPSPGEKNPPDKQPDSCDNNKIEGIIGYDGTNIDVSIKKKVTDKDEITLASLSMTVPSTPQIFNPKRHLLIPEKEHITFNDGIIISHKVSNESVVKMY